MEEMDNFIYKMESKKRLSHEKKHLFILNGHKSHINLEVFLKAKNHGIDMISPPNHTSHKLYFFDKAYFRPFKMAFGAYRDVWLNKKNGNKYNKQYLSNSASLAQKYPNWIWAIGIWPLNLHAMQLKIWPSVAFHENMQNKIERKEIIKEGILVANMSNTIIMALRKK